MSTEETMMEEKEKGILYRYFEWCFEGRAITVVGKFVWTGMWITALTTFQFIEAAVIFGVGAGLWFVLNDYQNWEIEFEETGGGGWEQPEDGEW